MATYAIGDIQGCFATFQLLLNKINFNPEKDQLWLVGDLINRGKNNFETLQFAYNNRGSIQLVLGNHDLHFLAVATGTRSAHRKDTFADILQSSKKNQFIDYLLQQPLIYFEPSLDFVMSHAGLSPQWSLDTAIALAKEVSDCLQSDNRHEFFKQMYGNEPASWQDALTGIDRLRYITNAFTRMRYCYADGSLDMEAKMPPGEQNEKLIPWFDLLPKELSYNLVFGHWASLSGQCEHPNLFAIDTGCVWGNQLTALRLEDKHLFQVDCAE